VSDDNLPVVPDHTKLAIPAEVMLAEIRRIIEDGSTQGELERVMAAVRIGHQERLKLVAMAVAQQRLGRIVRMLATMDRLEDELNDPVRMGPNTRTNDLLKALKYYSTEMYRALDFVLEQLGENALEEMGAGREIHLHKHDHLHEAPKIGREDRERIRKLVGVIGKHIDAVMRGEPVEVGRAIDSGNGDTAAGS